MNSHVTPMHVNAKGSDQITTNNQSLHVVDLNIDRYDMIIGCDLIRSLGIDIHRGDMTIHWDDAAIPWRDIDSTAKDVFALSQHNAPSNAETKRMKRILDAKYSKADIKTIAESSTHLDPQERNELYKILKKYESLFEREFMYAWNRERFSMIWFRIRFKFNIIGLTMPCA